MNFLFSSLYQVFVFSFFPSIFADLTQIIFPSSSNSESTIQLFKEPFACPLNPIEQAIEFAEDELDRYTQTTYLPNEDNGTASSATSTSLVDSSKSWTSSQWVDYAVYIWSGTGKGQIREITANDDTSLTVGTWTTTPDSTSKYLITYYNKVTETYDGTGTNTLMVRNYPLIQVDSLTIDDVSVTPSYVHVYNNTGRIVLSPSAESNQFTAPNSTTDNQLINITYWYGVLPEFKRGKIKIKGYITRLVGIIAGLQAITYQIGGTYDDLSTFSVPNLSGSIGQAYINIRETAKSLIEELNRLKQETIGKYPYMV